MGWPDCVFQISRPNTQKSNAAVYNPSEQKKRKGNILIKQSITIIICWQDDNDDSIDLDSNTVFGTTAEKKVLISFCKSKKKNALSMW